MIANSNPCPPLLTTKPDVSDSAPSDFGPAGAESPYDFSNLMGQALNNRQPAPSDSGSDPYESSNFSAGKRATTKTTKSSGSSESDDANSDAQIASNTYAPDNGQTAPATVMPALAALFAQAAAKTPSESNAEQSAEKTTPADSVVSVDARASGLSRAQSRSTLNSAGLLQKLSGKSAATNSVGAESDSSAANADPPANPVDAERAKPAKQILPSTRLDGLELPESAKNGLISRVSPGGTSAALNTESMKTKLNMNEIADAAVQKVPPPGPGSESSTDSDSRNGGKSLMEASAPKDEPFIAPSLMHLPPGMVSATAATTAAPHDIGQTVTTADKAVQLTHLISQESLTLRQSGASSLAVSLKVDPQTELLLQLKNHGGRIEATLRCERGDMSGLERHWSQLQESLARQNVYLTPPGEKFFRRGGDLNSSSGNSNPQLSEQKNPKQPPTPRVAPVPNNNPDATAANARTHATSTTHPADSGWESWA
jgi:hypothetical protein